MWIFAPSWEKVCAGRTAVLYALYFWFLGLIGIFWGQKYYMKKKGFWGNFVSCSLALIQIWRRWCTCGCTAQFAIATSDAHLQPSPWWPSINVFVYLYAETVKVSMEMGILHVVMMAVRRSAVGVVRVGSSTAVVTVPVYFVRSVPLLHKLRICFLCNYSWVWNLVTFAC